MFNWTSLVLAGLVCGLTVPAGEGPQALGCLPPPITQNYVKKMVRAEIKGKLKHVHGKNRDDDPFYGRLDIAIIDYWRIDVGGKSYRLGFNGDEHLTDLAGKLEGQTVIVSGILDGNRLALTDMRADEGYVKETTEVTVRGELRALLVRCGPGSKLWDVVVDERTYTLDLATPALKQQAEALDGKTVVLTGTLQGAAITVKTLEGAPL
jgi:hypothetical protein